MENKFPGNRIGNFVDHGDGTVTDTRTGLMWMRCALGQTWDGTTCVGESEGFTWDEAMALRHDFAGYDDWRLPDIDALKSIVDHSQISPTINRQAFPKATSAYFWSSSTDLPFALGIYFNNGTSGHRDKHNSRYVRLLRGGLPISRKTKQEPSSSFLNGENGEPKNQGVTLKPIINGAISSDHAPISEITTIVERLQLLEEKLSGSISRVEHMGDAHLPSKSIVRTAINYIRQQPELFAAEIAELRGFLGVAGATHLSAPVATNSSVPAEPETLEQIVAWLTTQETVALPELRTRLLPLDLLPGAVIDDLNERALELTGDLALEEDGEKFIIVREVLAQVVVACQGR